MVLEVYELNWYIYQFTALYMNANSNYLGPLRNLAKWPPLHHKSLATVMHT